MSRIFNETFVAVASVVGNAAPARAAYLTATVDDEAEGTPAIPAVATVIVAVASGVAPPATEELTSSIVASLPIVGSVTLVLPVVVIVVVKLPDVIKVPAVVNAPPNT